MLSSLAPWRWGATGRRARQRVLSRFRAELLSRRGGKGGGGLALAPRVFSFRTTGNPCLLPRSAFRGTQMGRVEGGGFVVRSRSVGRGGSSVCSTPTSGSSGTGGKTISTERPRGRPPRDYYFSGKRPGFGGLGRGNAQKGRERGGAPRHGGIFFPELPALPGRTEAVGSAGGKNA